MKKFLFVLLALFLFLKPSFAKSEEALVVSLGREINNSSVDTINRAIDQASKKGISNLIIDLDAVGGSAEAASAISAHLIESKLNVITFVESKAKGASVIIALSSDELYLKSGAEIGPATMNFKTETDSKEWSDLIGSTAADFSRNPKAVLKMLNADGSNKIAKSFSAKEASDLKISNGTYNSLEELIEGKDLARSEITESLSDRFISFITERIALSILLIVAAVGAVVEIMTPGFGIGGVISLVSFVLFFMGNLLAGNSQWYAIAIFIVGIFLIGLEIMIPGFGLPGISGIIAISLGIILAIGNITLAFISFGIAVVISVIVGLILFRSGVRSELFKKIQLIASSNSEDGYLSCDIPNVCVGDIGVSICALRPTGFANINDRREEVIANRGYISANEKISVVRISGSKIFVEKV